MNGQSFEIFVSERTNKRQHHHLPSCAGLMHGVRKVQVREMMLFIGTLTPVWCFASPV
jgi:hypothetical protein